MRWGSNYELYAEYRMEKYRRETKSETESKTTPGQSSELPKQLKRLAAEGIFGAEERQP